MKLVLDEDEVEIIVKALDWYESTQRSVYKDDEEGDRVAEVTFRVKEETDYERRHGA